MDSVESSFAYTAKWIWDHRELSYFKPREEDEKAIQSLLDSVPAPLDPLSVMAGDLPSRLEDATDKHQIDAIVEEHLEQLSFEEDMLGFLSAMPALLNALSSKIPQKGYFRSRSEILALQQDFSFLDVHFGAIFIKWAQFCKSFTFSGGYRPSTEIVSYLGSMADDYFWLDNETEVFDSSLVLGLWDQVYQDDSTLLLEHLDYLKLLTVLLYLSMSPFVERIQRLMAYETATLFCSMLSNCRISKLICESCLESELAGGARATTKMEIFFVQSNGDRYCLRIDFPHSGVKYIHYNLHDPIRRAPFPVSQEEYGDLKKNGVPEEYLEEHFYKNAGFLWFRQNVSEESLRDEMATHSCLTPVYELYKEHMHVRAFNHDATTDEAKTFLNLVWGGLVTFGAKFATHERTSKLDIASMLSEMSYEERIRSMRGNILREVFRARITNDFDFDRLAAVSKLDSVETSIPDSYSDAKKNINSLIKLLREEV